MSSSLQIDEDSLTEEMLFEMRGEVAAIHAKTDAMLSLTKDSNVPLGLKSLLRDTFKCHNCAAAPMKPPVLLAI